MAKVQSMAYVWSTAFNKPIKIVLTPRFYCITVQAISIIKLCHRPLIEVIISLSGHFDQSFTLNPNNFLKHLKFIITQMAMGNDFADIVTYFEKVLL